MVNKSSSLALIISNEYKNIPSIKLNGCHNDADNFINSIKKINPKTSFIIMRDTLPQTSLLFPSKKNIINQLKNFCSSPEIVSFLYYSGHGSSVKDLNGDESNEIIGNGSIQRDSTNSLNSTFNDSCIVTNEGSMYDFLIDDDINTYFKKIASNKRVYAFFDSCNSGTIIDLYSMFYINPKNNFNFISKTIPQLLVEMNNNTNKTEILSTYYPKKTNEIKGNVILLSGTRDNTCSYEGNNLDIISGNFTSRLCWLLNNGIGKMSLNDFYLSIVGLLNNPEQIPVITCSKFISIKKTTMSDFDNGLEIKNTPIPFLINTTDDKQINENSNYEYDSIYNTSDEELLIIDQSNNNINTFITKTDNQVVSQVVTQVVSQDVSQADNQVVSQVVSQADNQVVNQADNQVISQAINQVDNQVVSQAEINFNLIMQAKLNKHVILLSLSRAKKQSSVNNIIIPNQIIDIKPNTQINIPNTVLLSLNRAKKQYS